MTIQQKSDFQIYLIEIKIIQSSKRPSNGQVLSVFFYNIRTVNITTKKRWR